MNDFSKLEEKFERRVRELFSHPNWMRRAGAAMDLGKIGRDPALKEATVKVLAQALAKDSDYNVRLRAAESLGVIGDTKVLEPLTKALEDGELAVRMHATQALGRLGKPAVEPLIEALKSNYSDVRIQAAIALGKIKDARATKPLIESLRVGVGWHAYKALVRIGKPAVEPLIEALKDSDEVVRIHAADSLAHIGDARALEPLIDTLKDSDKRVRRAAVSGLKKIGGEKAEKAIKDYLKQTPWYKR